MTYPLLSLLLVVAPSTSTGLPVSFDSSAAETTTPEIERTEPSGEIEDGATLVRYDLLPVMPQVGDAWSDTLIPAIRHDYAYERSSASDDMYRRETPEVVLDVVTRTLGDELQFEGRSIALDGDASLLVLAPPAVHAKIRRILDALESAFASAIQMQVDVYTLDDTANSQRAIAEENLVAQQDADRIGEALVRAGARHAKHVVSLSPGRASAVNQMRSESFICDYDVEIAQGSVAFDPIASPLETGARLILRGAPGNGGVRISMLVAHDELLGLRERKLKSAGTVGSEREGGVTVIDGPTGLQLVDVMTRAITLTTFVPDNQAVLIESELALAGGTTRQLVVLRTVGNAGAPYHSISLPNGTISLKLVNSDVMSQPLVGIGLQEQDHGLPWVLAESAAGPSQFFYDWLKYRFSVYRRLGPWAVVVTDPAWDGGAAGELEKLVRSIEFPSTTLGVSVELTRDGASAAQWSFPMLAGTECGSVLGVTSTHLVDYDVEVAQFASVYDPVVVPTFAGLVCELTASRKEGSVSVAVRGSGYSTNTSTRQFELVDAVMGPVDQLSTDRLRFDESRALSIGGALSLRGATSEEGAGLGLSVRVR